MAAENERNFLDFHSGIPVSGDNILYLNVYLPVASHWLWGLLSLYFFIVCMSELRIGVSIRAIWFFHIWHAHKTNFLSSVESAGLHRYADRKTRQIFALQMIIQK